MFENGKTYQNTKGVKMRIVGFVTERSDKPGLHPVGAEGYDTGWVEIAADPAAFRVRTDELSDCRDLLAAARSKTSSSASRSKPPALEKLDAVDECNLWRKKAFALWQLLDDIDTAEDAIKPDDLDGYKRFYTYAHKRHIARHSILTSDGYRLYLPGDEPVIDGPSEPVEPPTLKPIEFDIIHTTRGQDDQRVIDIVLADGRTFRTVVSDESVAREIRSLLAKLAHKLAPQ